MIAWIQANIASIAVMAVVILLLALAIRRIVLDKIHHTNTCGGSCGGCKGCSGGCDGCH